MPLPAGTRLGPYEIVAFLDAGGMGEVYRGLDPRLGREVAIKILPPGFTTDAERLRRFEQEARATAALNHPNILAVHDLGQHDGAPYIVSELLEGETLREHLAGVAPATGDASQRPLAPRRAIDCAIQIARGLSAAHERGIVHRDLKPENVFLTTDGHVKILDFGLAKLSTAASVSSMTQAVPPGTVAGVVMGTVGYMAPEQVRGQTADHRADIFSLGAILYEMLAGARAFARESGAETMTAILKDDPPPIPSSDARLTPGLARIVDRCLEKSPSARFQSAHDLAFALEGLSGHSEPGAAVVPGRRRPRVQWAIAAGLVLAVGLALTWYALRTTTGGSEDQPAFRFQLAGPVNAPFSQTAISNFLAISPDRRRLAFAAGIADGASGIWVHHFETGESKPMAGTEGGRQPFWSPDGRSIAFFTSGTLKRVPAEGGPAQTISNTPNVPTGGTWGANGVILFSGLSGPIRRVPASGGTPEPATEFDVGQERWHSFPVFLPDGRRFLFLRAHLSPEHEGVYVKDLDAPGARLVIRASSNMALAEAHLVYAREGTLVAQPFDDGAATVSGEPKPVGAERLEYFPEVGNAAFAVVGNVLVFRGAPHGSSSRLTWIDRTGRTVASIGQPGPYRNPRLSPDGSRVAMEVVESSGNRDIWVMDLARGVPVRFTFDPGRDASPVWSKDGRHIVWQGHAAVYIKASSGLEREEVLQKEAWIPDDSLPDGGGLLLHPVTPRQVWLVPRGQPETARRAVIEGRNITTHARVSPDGRWVAFANMDSGRFEIHIQNFPDAVGRWQVSTEGGIQPKWRADGKELFYLALDGTLMAVPISLGPLPEIGKPTALFQTRVEATTGFTWHQYDVAPDGQRFLVNQPETLNTPLTVLVNWTRLLHP